MKVVFDIQSHDVFIIRVDSIMSVSKYLEGGMSEIKKNLNSKRSKIRKNYKSSQV